jgi:hypothetical protein
MRKIEAAKLTVLRLGDRVEYMSSPGSLKSVMHATKNRVGITLIEVLISMFVLLIGLLGVAAMFPAGRYEIMQGVKADYGAMLGRQMSRDIKARGFLNPTGWTSRDKSSGNPIPAWDSTNPIQPFVNPQTGAHLTLMPVAIDPLGLEVDSHAQLFPALVGSTSIARVYPTPQSINPAIRKAIAQGLQLCPDDVVTQLDTTGRDKPPLQQPVPFGAATGSAIARASNGNYSWIATIVPDPTPQATIESKMTVSIAVFYKRDLSPVTDPFAPTPPSNLAPSYEALATLSFAGGNVHEAALVLKSDPARKFDKGVRPGQWIMVTDGTGFRWYRIVSASPMDARIQQISLHGPDWNLASADAWLFDGIISVYEKNISLEMN